MRFDAETEMLKALRPKAGTESEEDGVWGGGVPLPTAGGV